VFTGTSSAADKKFDFTGNDIQVVPIGFLTSDASQSVSTLQQVPVITNNTYSTQINDNVRQQLSLNLNIPIFNNLVSRTGVQRAKLQTELAKLQLETVSNQLKKDVQNAFYDVKSSQANLTASEKKLEAMKKVKENAQVRYNNGLMSSTDFLNAVNNHSNAENDSRQAKYTYVFNIKILDFYMGNEIKF